ncbi:tight adherence protein G [Cricetibacter osteomyelitidis]|uniref:Tight adherence protein G n=1 Tax=Cricetibacter osteomyelitidis TaxID=1521931 RepID=A0A4V2T1S3_9PAST|nr:TadE/TadG family type IV pilus assembly protein [Cricetibacter osteomyelitidis]TCP94663.1 tight adherence protein G [Cricetibacter osteomyelitidis]
MKNSFYFTRLFLHKIKRFYHDESGVYAVMTALLLFPLLVVIAFAVDGSGILLDKARLAQATSQAALSLTAENNKYREKSHDDVDRQSFTPEQLKKFGNSKSAKQDSRNLELVHGIAKAYFYSKKNNDQTDFVTITDNFRYKCEEVDSLGPNRYEVRKPVVCEVQGKVNRQFWLPWGTGLVENSLMENRLPIDSGLTYAVKQKGITVPIDLMLVSDFSGSMLQDVNGNEAWRNRKIDILVSVVKDIQDLLLPAKPSADVSPYNRMGFSAFAGGAKQLGERGQECVLPYYVKDDRYSEIRDSLRRGHWPNERNFNRKLDVEKTIGDIKNFNGKKRDYKLILNNPGSCLGDNYNIATTDAWFDQKNKNISGALKKITPKGWTAATSGMIIGANVMMIKNEEAKAKPEELGTNTQRVMLVLSDGEDNKPTERTLITLLENNLCNAIRERVDTLQDNKYPRLPTRIAFVAFGYTPNEKQEKVWKQCVGNDQYYKADSREGLLKAFKQIISFEEEVGTSSSKKPKLK